VIKTIFSYELEEFTHKSVTAIVFQ